MKEVQQKKEQELAEMNQEPNMAQQSAMAALKLSDVKKSAESKSWELPHQQKNLSGLVFLIFLLPPYLCWRLCVGKFVL